MSTRSQNENKFGHWEELPGGGLDQPRDIDALTHVQDLLPTLIDLCGISAPDNAHFDGASLAPLLSGRAETLPDPDRMLVVQYGEPPRRGNAAVLWKKWRLVGGRELYRVDDDPGQKRNVASDHVDVAERMQAHYEQWWEDVQPGLKETPRIHLGAEAANSTTLYASDWRGDYADNWGGLGPGNRKGAWKVSVMRPGEYELTLYRWPPEAKTPLDAPLSGPRGRRRAVTQTAARLGLATTLCPRGRPQKYLA